MSTRIPSTIPLDGTLPEMMELLFWLDEFNPSALHLFLPTEISRRKMQ